MILFGYCHANCQYYSKDEDDGFTIHEKFVSHTTTFRSDLPKPRNSWPLAFQMHLIESQKPCSPKMRGWFCAATATSVTKSYIIDCNVLSLQLLNGPRGPREGAALCSGFPRRLSMSKAQQWFSGRALRPRLQAQQI